MLVIEYFPEENTANFYYINGDGKKLYYEASNCEAILNDGCVFISNIETGDIIFKGIVPIFYF